MRDTLTLGEIAEGLSLEGNEAMEWIEGRWRDGFRQLQSQTAELERLRHRLDKSDGAMAAMNNSTGKAVGEKVAAMALATQLAKYADHDTSCPFDGLSPCNCGLGQLLIKAREMGVIP